MPKFKYIGPDGEFFKGKTRRKGEIVTFEGRELDRIQRSHWVPVEVESKRKVSKSRVTSKKRIAPERRQNIRGD